MDILTAILAIGALIVVHEAGHYFVARWCGMRVERFSIGFGPKLFGFKSKKTGTQFQIAPIPFGGFVEIKGMNILEEVDPNDATAYPNRPVWQRFLTIFAGPATNYLFAIVLAFILFAGAGMRTAGNVQQVAGVIEGSAAQGVLEPGDRILAIEGQPFDPEAAELSKIVNEHGPKPLAIEIDRGGETKTVTLTPRLDDGTMFKQVAPRYRIGVYYGVLVTREKVGVLTAAKEAFVYPFVQTKMIVVGLYEWAVGKQEGEVSSVVGITKVMSQAISEGWVVAVSLLMLLNVYLGMFNLFPLPALDGGRLVFLGYEMVTRRRANPKFEATVHMVGVLALIVLIAVVTFNDIRRL